MIYMTLIILGFIISILIKICIYSKPHSKGFVQWLQNLYLKHKYIFLIEVFLIGEYLLCYNKYGLSIKLLNSIVLSSILLTISIIDTKNKIIPDKLVVLGIITGIIMVILNKELSIIKVLLVPIICGGIIALISIIAKGAIGMGDAKLFAFIAIYIGLEATIQVMFISTIISGLVGLFLLIAKKVNRKTTLPFSPFIFVSIVFTILLN